MVLNTIDSPFQHNKEKNMMKENSEMKTMDSLLQAGMSDPHIYVSANGCKYSLAGVFEPAAYQKHYIGVL